MTSNTLQHFGLAETEIIRSNGEFYLTVTQLAGVLVVDRKRIHEAVRRNKDDFAELLDRNLRSPNGGWLFGEEEVYVLCMTLRSSDKAKEFRRAFARALKAIRRREFVHVSELRKLQAELGQVTEKWVSAKQRISTKRISRYHELRKLGLSQTEAARAARMPFRSAVRLERAKLLATAGQLALPAGGAQ